MSAFDGTNGPTLKVQFYFNSAWTNVPVTDLREVSITRGRTRADQKFDPGTMTIVLDNRSGDYDPDNLSGPWVSGGISALRDGLRGRIVATWSSTAYTLYDGYMETPSLDAGFDATATITFTDALAKFAKANAPALKSASYSGETTATRVGRMLTYAGWPTGSSWRSISGSVTVTKTTQDAPITDIIDACVAAEAGSFYVSRSGVATFLNLSHKFSRPTQLLFDDLRSADTVEYNSLKTTPGTLQVVNYAAVNYGINGKKQYQKVVQSNSSISKYGYKRVEVTTPILVAKVAAKLAQYYAYKDAKPTTTVSEINFTALALGSLYPDFLETELQDQVSVQRTTVDGRHLGTLNSSTGKYSMNLVVEGMDHKITPDDWQVTYFTSPMNPYRVTLP